MFQPGHQPYVGPGRPKGSLNKTTTEAKALAQQLVNDPIYRENLLKRLQAGEGGQIEQIIWHYAYGKPKESIEHSWNLERLNDQELDQLENILNRIQ